MEEMFYYPKNKKHFSKLILFAKELFEICRKLNVKPVIYGSVAYAVYTKDESININDVDALVPKLYFSKIISKIKDKRDIYYEETNYNSLKIFKDKLKITSDSIEEYYKNLSQNFVKVKVNNIPFIIVSLESLREIYRKVKDRTILSKRKGYSEKFEKLSHLK